jgi:hypothetical protein
VDPVDLSVLAQRFEADIDRWQQETAVGSDTGEADTVSVVKPEVETAVPVDSVRADSIQTRSDSAGAGKPGLK